MSDKDDGPTSWPNAMVEIVGLLVAAFFFWICIGAPGAWWK